jgi:hypothetical protein
LRNLKKEIHDLDAIIDQLSIEVDKAMLDDLGPTYEWVKAVSLKRLTEACEIDLTIEVEVATKEGKYRQTLLQLLDIYGFVVMESVQSFMVEALKLKDIAQP